MIFPVGVSLVYFFFNRELMLLFTDNPAVISVGAEWLRILSYAHFVYGRWMVTANAFNEAGDTRTPTKINPVFFRLIQIPPAWLLALHFGWGASGVF